MVDRRCEGVINLVTYCCDRCKKAIEEDDIEAIEVEQMKYRMLLFHHLKEDDEFKPVRQNTVNENQNHHYCGECKGDFYEIT